MKSLILRQRRKKHRLSFVITQMGIFFLKSGVTRLFQDDHFCFLTAKHTWVIQLQLEGSG